MTAINNPGFHKTHRGNWALLLIGAFLLVACGDEKSAAPVEQKSAPATDIKKVVWHVDFGDPRRLGRMLTSVNNMIVTYEEMFVERDIRIVFLADGIRFLTSDPLKGTPFEEDKVMAQERKVLTERLKSAMAQGIKLELCQITQNAVGLSRDKIMEGVDPVPSGVVRITDLEAQGYAYLKAD